MLIDCFWNFVFDWFKNQSNFIFLHKFDIVLTNAFFFKQNNSSFFSIFTSKSTREIFENSVDSFVLSRKQQKLKISISNRCQWCQLNYETYIIHRFQYFSCVARTQQAYEFVLQFLEKKTCEIFECSVDFVLTTSSVSQESQKQQKSNVLKIAKKTKFNAIKNVKRIKSKTLKAKEATKSTFIVQNVDIFDSILTCENRRFSDVAKFLQHFQHCQRLYRKSDLLILLFICLDDVAFDIWYNKQNVMTSTSLSEWIKVLRIEFVIFAKSISAEICMRCDSNFNSKKKFRKHVREQHAKKFVNNSFFSNDTVKFVCEIEKNSTVIEAFALQTSHFLHTTSRNQVISEIVSSKNSSFLTEKLKIISEFMKNASNQKITNIRTICKFCKQNFNFNRKLYEHIRNHEILKLVKNFYFSINAVSLTCKTIKKSAIIDVFAEFARQEFDIFVATSRHKFEFVMIFEAINSSKNSHFMSNTSKTVSELIENTSIQCSFVSSKSSFFVAFVTSSKQIFEFSENQVQKFSVVSFSFSNDIVESICEIQKNSATCRRCNKIFNFNNKFHEHIREHHARKFVKSLNFRVLTSEFTCKIKEKSVFICSFVSFVSQKLFIFFATSRSQMFSTQTVTQFLSSKCSNLSIATYKISSKSMKSAIVVCSLIFSSIFSTSVRKHQKFHIQKFYLIVNDLKRTFVEKHKSFDLQQHQNRCRFSQNFDFRQLDRSCLIFSKKFYLIIEDLSEMFDGKFKKKNLFQSQNNVFSQTFSSQMKIIFYFKFTINQKSSINQNSKNSKSKKLNQHMFAKSIRIVSRSLSEKLINLSYKSTDVFCVKNKSLQILDFYKSEFSKSRISVKTFFLILVFFRLFPIFLLVFAFVSIVSATRTDCINVYEQVVSIIDRVIR